MRNTHEPRGATSIEYAIMVGLIALVIVVAVGLVGTAANALFESASSSPPGI